MLGAGLNAWHLGDGNYWGHNAIINTSFFTQHCGLPNLAGKPPFGGHILSHDFIEAALMRRAGWQVWLLTEVEGCYEQVPPTLLDNEKRERRWVQGNLQHTKLLFAAGLHPLSRLHLFTGIAAYKASLLCFLFLLVGMGAAIYGELVPPDYFGDTVTLFPTWPLFDGEQAMVLLGIVFTMLILPKIMAGLTVMGSSAKAFGGRGRVWFSVLVEHIYTALIAPVLMLVHTTFIIDVLLGRDSGWGKQNRGDAETTWREAWQRHRLHMLFGIAIAGVGYSYAPSLVWWLSPVVLGLLLAPFLSVWSSRVSVGQWFLRRKLLLTPEESFPPPEWNSVKSWEARISALLPTHTGPLGNVEAVLNNPLINALHISLLSEKSFELVNMEDLAKAKRKLAANEALTNNEKLALLYDAESLTLHAKVA
jgi:membrane glycosyltransferase